MEENNFKAILPVNFEQKCACVLVLDTSGSMDGEPINEMNMGLIKFKEEIQTDITASNRLEISIVSFNSEVKVVSGFSLIDQWTPPTLKAGGETKLVEGIERAIQVLETRKAWYKETGQKYYRPYIILITDGEPQPENEIGMSRLKQTLYEAVNKKQFNFWAFGVQNANMEKLKSISHSEFPPQKLQGLEFVKFFKWLSNSMSAISNSKEGESVNIKPKTEDENPFGFQITV